MNKEKLIKLILGIFLGIVCIINGYYIFKEMMIPFFICTVIGSEIIFVLFAMNDYESHNHFGTIVAIKFVSLLLSAFMSCIASMFIILIDMLIDKWNLVGKSLIYVIGIIILIVIYIYLNKKLYNKISR